MINNKKNVVWIVSYPKSGSTWFRLLLSNLFSNSNRPVDINELHDTPIASNRNIFDQTLGINSSDLTFDEIESLRPHVYKVLSRNSDRILYFKVHDAWTHTKQREEIFPASITKGVVYIIRNPLDISISFAHHNNVEIGETIKNMNNPEFGFCSSEIKLSKQLRQKLLSWSGHVSSWVDQSGLPLHILKYENLLSDTFNSLSQVLNFLELNYKEEDINTSIANSKFETLQKQEEKSGFREKSIKSEVFFRKGIENEWKSSLTFDQVSELVSVHHNIMQRFGYNVKGI
jgi:hypothetical protein